MLSIELQFFVERSPHKVVEKHKVVIFFMNPKKDLIIMYATSIQCGFQS